MKFRFCLLCENGSVEIKEYLHSIGDISGLRIFIKYDRVFQETDMVNYCLVCDSTRVNGEVEIWY